MCVSHRIKSKVCMEAWTSHLEQPLRLQPQAYGVYTISSYANIMPPACINGDKEASYSWSTDSKTVAFNSIHGFKDNINLILELKFAGV